MEQDKVVASTESIPEVKKDTKPEVEKVEEPEEATKIGTVTDCGLLNVRNKPSMDSKVLFTIPESANVVIDLEKSTDDFYNIFTEVGLEGFVRKEYIKV